MQKQAPSLGRILVMVLFALSCFGLLLFLWLSFGGPIEWIGIAGEELDAERRRGRQRRGPQPDQADGDPRRDRPHRRPGARPQRRSDRGIVPRSRPRPPAVRPCGRGRDWSAIRSDASSRSSRHGSASGPAPSSPRSRSRWRSAWRSAATTGGGCPALAYVSVPLLSGDRLLGLSDRVREVAHELVEIRPHDRKCRRPLDLRLALRIVFVEFHQLRRRDFVGRKIVVRQELEDVEATIQFRRVDEAIPPVRSPRSQSSV